jgi:hypothetical protein
MIHRDVDDCDLDVSWNALLLIMISLATLFLSGSRQECRVVDCRAAIVANCTGIVYAAADLECARMLHSHYRVMTASLLTELDFVDAIIYPDCDAGRGGQSGQGGYHRRGWDSIVEISGVVSLEELPRYHRARELLVSIMQLLRDGSVDTTAEFAFVSRDLALIRMTRMRIIETTAQLRARHAELVAILCGDGSGDGSGRDGDSSIQCNRAKLAALAACLRD